MKSLQYSLHQLIQDSNELLNLRVCMVAIIGLFVAVAGLAIAIVVPCVCHLRGFSREGITL
jgi:hypothetical protein